MTPRTHPDVVWVDDENGISMYDARTSQFTELNQAAAEIWRLAVAGQDMGTIVTQLARSYEAKTESDWGVLRRDVEMFLRQLIDAQILVEDRPDGAVSVAASQGRSNEP